MNATPENFQDVVSLVLDYVALIIPLLIAVAVLVFIWGLTVFIRKSGDSKSHEDGRRLMIWGIVGIFVMVSFMGIIRIFYNDFGFTQRPGQPVFGIPYLPIGAERP